MTRNAAARSDAAKTEPGPVRAERPRARSAPARKARMPQHWQGSGTSTPALASTSALSCRSPRRTSRSFLVMRFLWRNFAPSTERPASAAIQRPSMAGQTPWRLCSGAVSSTRAMAAAHSSESDAYEARRQRSSWGRPILRGARRPLGPWSAAMSASSTTSMSMKTVARRRAGEGSGAICAPQNRSKSAAQNSCTSATARR
mmetsp:Transcript_21157/g.63147  ORF Transcript_21157/g.63147 Transcript_21157/m.63147 type:complete len:201 (-) Transcript_21157:163-765(-)